MIHYQDERATVYHGDCLGVLQGMEEASIDAVVCDPPYGLEFMGKEWDGADGFRRSLNANDVGRDNAFGRASRTSPEYRAGHLFQQWCEMWTVEAFRVLKPGGHLLAFGGTRTWHRLAVAVEDAGFEIRDSIAWLYGSGFPKSLDVSKAIDKAAGAEREVVGSRRMHKRPSLNGNYNADGRTTDTYNDDPSRQQVRDEPLTAPTTPEAAQWSGWGTALKPAFEPVVVARKPIGGIIRTVCGRCQGEGEEYQRDCPNCGGEGYITRKVGATVAANVLAHGTGALNIDGCRIDYQSENDKASARPQGVATSLIGALAGKAQTWSATPSTDAQTTDTSTNSQTTDDGALNATGNRTRTTYQPATSSGRWPANVILDADQAAALDEQTGNLSVNGPAVYRREKEDAVKDRSSYVVDRRAGEVRTGFGDSGGASRFFKVVEGSDCRGWGCNCPGYSLDNRTNGGGLCGCCHDASTHYSQGAPEVEERFRYVAKAPKKERPVVDGVAHPTVKPLALMRWLVRLVTPPGGVVLDPFAGSGTTVEAALLEGFDVLGIEREADYLPMILQRIERAQLPGPEPEPDLFTEPAA